MVTWTQMYMPMGGLGLSALVALIPIIFFFVALAVLRLKGHVAGAITLILSILIAIFAFKMPIDMAFAAAGYGFIYGLWPIAWIIVAAVFLYKLTVASGQFDIIRSSVISITDDQRLQVLLIGFSFGALLEGAAGFGAPVAITGALLVGLGFKPLYAAGLCLIANTAPVAFGALGVPILVAGQVTGIDPFHIGAMAGRQLPFLSVLVPFWLVAMMDGWKGVKETWPAALVAGGSFAVTQFFTSNYIGPELPDITSALVSIVSLALFLKVWRPKNTETAISMGQSAGAMVVNKPSSGGPVPSEYSLGQIIRAWSPFLILTVLVTIWTMKPFKALFAPGGAFYSLVINFQIPHLHQQVLKAAPIVAQPTPMDAVFKFDPLSAGGTAIFIAAIISIFILGVGIKKGIGVFAETVVPMENDVLKVVKSSAAKVEPLPLVGEGSDNYAGDEMVTKVVPVRNVSVRELAPILRQMIDSAGSGNVVNYDPSNVIMLTGRASVVERLTEVIQRVDHAGNRTEEVIPLDNASASEIARVLESLTKNSGENQPATLKSQIVADERTNSVIVSGDPATRDKMRRLIRRLDSEMERSGNSQVFYLKYSKAEDLVDVLKQVSGTLTAAKEEAEGTVGSGREVVSIAASKHSNALIVTAPQDIMQSLQSVIEQLDIRRAQVHVEALIVEVAEGSNINFGVQWGSKDAGLMQFANGTQIPIGTLGAAISAAKPQKGSTVISENGATTINPDTNGDLSTLAQLLSGFSGTAVGVVKGDWMALVQAVKNDSSSNVLSTPSITTLDNQEAFFMVGQDVPVLTGSTVGSNNSNPFNTVERKKVGIMLKVTPQINEGNAVQMVIEQEVSKVEGQTSLDVVFGERKLKTTVLANDGELIVLGGLMDDQAGESVAKVPLLGDIPLIGNLFKSTADKKEKRNLMVFIRPTILRDGMAADGVSQRKYNYMRAEQIYRDEQGLSLMPHTAQPILPAQNQALPPEVRAFLNAGRTR